LERRDIEEFGGNGLGVPDSTEAGELEGVEGDEVASAGAPTLFPDMRGGAWADVWQRYEELRDDPLAPVLPIPWAWPTTGLSRRMVDSKTGRLASEWCPEEQRYQEYFIPGTEPTEVCDLFGRSIFAR
jgi:hypothetical protein